MVRPFPPVRATPPIAHAEMAMIAYPLAAFGVADATLAVERIPAIAERPPEIIYVEKRTPFTLIPENYHQLHISFFHMKFSQEQLPSIQTQES